MRIRIAWILVLSAVVGGFATVLCIMGPITGGEAVTARGQSRFARGDLSGTGQDTEDSTLERIRLDQNSEPQRRVDPVTDIEATKEATDSEPPTSYATTLSDQIDKMASTFLTDSPDTRGLITLVAQLSGKAQVIDDSITRDSDTGIVTGRLRVLGLDADCFFEINAEEVRVSLLGSGDTGDRTSVARDVVMSFRKGESTFGCIVQFHPPTDVAASTAPKEGEERYVGWAMKCGTEGSRTRPLTIKRNGSAFIIGHSQNLAALDQPWLWDSTAASRWLSLLTPYAK